MGGSITLCERERKLHTLTLSLSWVVSVAPWEEHVPWPEHLFGHDAMVPVRREARMASFILMAGGVVVEGTRCKK